MLRKPRQYVGRNAVFLVGLVRVRADGAEHVVVAIGDREQRVEPAHARRDRHDAADARRARAADDAVEVIGEIRKVEMAMAIDEHWDWHSVFVIARSKGSLREPTATKQSSSFFARPGLLRPRPSLCEWPRSQ